MRRNGKRPKGEQLGEIQPGAYPTTTVRRDFTRLSRDVPDHPPAPPNSLIASRRVRAELDAADASRGWSPSDYAAAWVRIHRGLRELSQDMFEEGDRRLFDLLATQGLETAFIQEYDR